VGKGSSAHEKALAVYQRKTKADRILKADDLLRQINVYHVSGKAEGTEGFPHLLRWFG